MNDFPDHCLLCGAPRLEDTALYECGCDPHVHSRAAEAWRRTRENIRAFVASLPPRYRHYARLPLPVEVETSNAGRIALGLKPGRNAYVYGSPGSGKTHLAVQATLRLIEEHGLSALFVGETDYFEQVFREFGGGPAAPDLKKPGVLVYDDFGKQKGSDFTFQKVYGMLEGRWSHERTFILTANFEPEDVVANVTSGQVQAESVLSRIYSGSVVELSSGDDHRVGGAA